MVKTHSENSNCDDFVSTELSLSFYIYMKPSGISVMVESINVQGNFWLTPGQGHSMLTTKVGTAIVSHCLVLRIKASTIHIIIIIIEAIKPGSQLKCKTSIHSLWSSGDEKGRGDVLAALQSGN